MPYSGGEGPEGAEDAKRAKGGRIRTGKDVGNFSLERFLLLGCTLNKSLCMLGVHIQHEVDDEVDDH